MKGRLIAGTVLAGSMTIATLSAVYAQQHPAEHSQRPTGPPSSMNDSESIFCPTMHTGQLCTHGTTNVLSVPPDKQDQWAQTTHRYNKAVEAATAQLMKDAEGVLTPEQLVLLKAWFQQGMNREINQLLYSKGLGAVKQ
jgi:hypothetical protein